MAIGEAKRDGKPPRQYIKAAVRRDLTNEFSKYERRQKCTDDVGGKVNDDGEMLEDAIESEFTQSLFEDVRTTRLSKLHQLALRLAVMDRPDLERYLAVYLETGGSDREVAKIFGISDKTVACRYRRPLTERVKATMILLHELRK